MPAPSSFALGLYEISPAAAEAFGRTDIDPATLFVRHAQGDWGDAPDWLRKDNDNAAQVQRHQHAIQSHYQYDTLPAMVVTTARDRARTRLMLAEEFREQEVSVQEGYAIWAAGYDYPNPLVAVEQPIMEIILARLLPVESALDIGTGTGRLARILAQKGAKSVLGIDATPEMLAVARENVQREGLSGLRFEQCQLGEEPLPAKSGSFDLLTCGLMLCYLPNMRDAMRNCVRVVRPGGYLLLSDFHPAVYSFGWRTDYITPDARYLMPNYPYTRQDYLDALTAAGCTLQEVHDIALGGEPYGEVTETAVKAKGLPPLCLVVLAQRNG